MGSTGLLQPIPEVIGILACLLASAFFSGTETALTRIPDPRAAHLIDDQPERFGILRFWLEHKKRILAALLVGNNLVNVLCSVLTYRIALKLLPSYAEAVSVFGLTLIVLVFAEITPKSIALYWGERFVVPLLRVVWIIDKLLWPLTVVLKRIPEFLLHRSGNLSQVPVVTEDEIEFQIRLGHDHKVFEEKEQGELLMSAVKFPDTMVKEVMVPRTDIFGLDVTTPMAEAIEGVISSGHSRIPVYRDQLDELVGLLYVKDLLRQVVLQAPGKQGTIEPLVRKPPYFVPETQKISELLTAMRRRGQHMGIVVDEFGGTSGLVTLEDIIEELVGEIRDEFDPDESMVRRLDENTWLVDARVSIHDFADQSGINLPDEGDYESVGGYVVARHGSIPRQGTEIEADGVRIAVLASDQRHVVRLQLERLPQIPLDDE